MPGEDPLPIAVLALLLPVPGVMLVALSWPGWLLPGLRRDRDRATGVAQSLAEARLHVRPALRAGLTAISAALVMLLLAATWGAALPLPAWLLTAVLLVLGWNTLALWLWELRYDRVGLSAPVLIFWRRSHLWRELVAVTGDTPFVWHFHFVDGSILRVPKPLAGREALMQMAQDWLHSAGSDDNARTARS